MHAISFWIKFFFSVSIFYVSVSLLNISFLNYSFHKDTLIVRAVKDVEPEGEIFNCYGKTFFYAILCYMVYENKTWHQHSYKNILFFHFFFMEWRATATSYLVCCYCFSCKCIFTQSLHNELDVTHDPFLTGLNWLVPIPRLKNLVCPTYKIFLWDGIVSPMCTSYECSVFFSLIAFLSWTHFSFFAS